MKPPMTPEQVRSIRDRDKRTVTGGEMRRLAESWLMLHERLQQDVDRAALARYRRLDQAGGVSND